MILLSELDELMRGVLLAFLTAYTSGEIVGVTVISGMDSVIRFFHDEKIKIVTLLGLLPTLQDT